MSRFTLIPDLPRVVLAPNLIQLGADPERACRLEVPNGRVAKLLDRLENWLDDAAYAVSARRLGIPGHEAEALLKLLRGNGFLLDADAADRAAALTPEAKALALRRGSAPGRLLASRRRHRVFVNAAGPLAREIAATLRRSELGQVWCADEGRRAKPTFTVLVNPPQPAELAARACAMRSRPYLVVSTLDGVVHVGPLVRPGRTPCAACVALHYRDGLPGYAPVDTGDHLEAPLLTMAASWAAMVVLQHIAGEECLAEAATIRLTPSLRFFRRRWDPHPECGCVAP